MKFKHIRDYMDNQGLYGKSGNFIFRFYPIYPYISARAGQSARNVPSPEDAREARTPGHIIQ